VKTQAWRPEVIQEGDVAYRGQEFLICPDCQKRGVEIHYAPRGEDGYGCRYCQFWFFIQGDYAADVENRMRLALLNPGYED
jgi:hypothetical protein